MIVVSPRSTSAGRTEQDICHASDQSAPIYPLSLKELRVSIQTSSAAYPSSPSHQLGHHCCFRRVTLPNGALAVQLAPHAHPRSHPPTPFHTSPSHSTTHLASSTSIRSHFSIAFDIHGCPARKIASGATRRAPLGGIRATPPPPKRASFASLPARKAWTPNRQHRCDLGNTKATGARYNSGAHCHAGHRRPGHWQKPCAQAVR